MKLLFFIWVAFLATGLGIAHWLGGARAPQIVFCHMEDACGVYPPYSTQAEYCGRPIVVCPGESFLELRKLQREAY